MSGIKLPLALSLAAHVLLLGVAVWLAGPGAAAAAARHGRRDRGGLRTLVTRSPEKPPTPPSRQAEPPPPASTTAAAGSMPPPPTAATASDRTAAARARGGRRGDRAAATTPPPPQACDQDACQACPQTPRARAAPSPDFAALNATGGIARRRRLSPRRRCRRRLPSTEVSPGYRALLSAWLESHKRYPDSAREQGEEGRAVLRFAVDRSGRVADFAIVTSSGYPDLDAAARRDDARRDIAAVSGRHGPATHRGLGDDPVQPRRMRRTTSPSGSTRRYKFASIVVPGTT